MTNFLIYYINQDPGKPSGLMGRLICLSPQIVRFSLKMVL